MKSVYPFVRFLIVLIISLGAIRPLFSPGFFPMHDDVQPARIIAMSRALQEGQFPVRWVGDLGYGYGYPLFNFYGPLPYYAGAAVNLITGDALLATKLMMGAGMLLAVVAMYVFVSNLLPFWGAAALSVLYMYAPYHGTQLYVRGAVGELWAYGFLPLVAAGVLGNVPLGIIGLFGIITSHTITGYITVGLVVAGWGLGVMFTRDKKLFKQLGLMILFGLGLSAFFWLPALAEMRFTNIASQIGGGADFRDHFVCIGQLWNSPLGYGGSAAGCTDGMSFKLGKLHIFLGVLGFLLFIKNWKRTKKQLRLVRSMEVALVLGSVFFMTPLSQKFWELLPYAAFVQYPWRLLTFATLGLVLLAGIIWRDLEARIGLYVGAVVIALAIFINAESFLPQYTYPATASDFESEYYLRFRASRVSDEYMPPNFVPPHNESEFVRDTITGTATSDSLILTLDKEGDVTIPRASFPGWQYWVDGTKTEARIVAGLPVFTLPPGAHTIEFRLTDTPVRRVANLISLASIVVLGVLYAKNKQAIA